MDYNKEVAIHAKEIAEKRLLKRDYAGAKEMALKAKKLFPLYNISQLLAVCEVHCSAQLLANGLYDWYKIIQVEPMSDEIMIRKQYHKLVVLLHPEKNKIPGAEAAFKLVGEANNILSDQAKRIMYDIKRKHLVCSLGPQQSMETNAAYNCSSNLNRANKWRPQQQPQPQQGFTFWTKCPGCRTLHQYYRSILSHIVCCTHCSRNFIANALPHLNPEHIDGGRNQRQQFMGLRQPQRSDSYKFTWDRGVGGTARVVTGGVRKPDSNPDLTSMSNSSGPNTITGKMGGKRVSADTRQNPNPSSKPNLSLDFNQRRGDGEGTGGALAAGTSTPLWRSPCNKPDVKYNGTEPGCSSPSKKARVEVKGVPDGNGSANAANTNTSVSTCVEEEVKEQDREKEKEKVEPSGLLEKNNTAFKPSGSAEDKGADSKKARVEVKGVQDGNGSANAANTSASTCVEGEVKEQDREKEKEQPSRLLEKNNTDFKPSGSAEDKGATYMKARVEVKGVQDVNGGAKAANTNTTASTCAEGEVKEQDTAKEKEQPEPSGLLEKNNTAFNPSASAEDRGASSRAANVGALTVRYESSQPNVDAEYLYEYPDAEFHNFHMSQTCNNIQQGHIWALYSDLDTFPKYYGSICKVEHNPLKVHISWLEACPKSEVERAWLDANFPISCGNFRATTQNTIYDKPEYFSHIVSVRLHRSGNYYEILPEVSEVWAIYKNWSAGWTPHDFKTCKFDIVEIIEHREESIIVWPLRQVPEYTSVFMPEQVDGTGSGTCKVPASAYILFSHKIPAIRLKEECGGKLKGLWELDPASVPYAFFNMSK